MHLLGHDVHEPYALAFASVASLILFHQTLDSGRRALGRWIDQVRDEQYMVGRRLHNIAADSAPAVN